MRLTELLTELTFQGRKCTKDCSGHMAGYQWAMKRPTLGPAGSHSPSFNSGAEVADNQKAAKKVISPKVRDEKGKFAAKPQLRQPKAAVKPLTPGAQNYILVTMLQIYFITPKAQPTHCSGVGLSFDF